jgi:NADPH:quinone reductase-like Zn-dependent oxidoreductase
VAKAEDDGSVASIATSGQAWSPRSRPPRVTMLASKERGKDFHLLRELIEAGKVTPVIDSTYELSEAPEGIGYIVDGRAHGKVVIAV